MGLSLYNIKKWTKMIAGKSVLHVNQDMGKSFVPGQIEGYFNNLTEKVTMEPELIDNDNLPVLKTENGKIFEFPVAIFQYGLGAYDLYLQTKDEKYLKKFLQTVKWASEKQLENGSWDNFSYIYPNNPYGAMCQGEGTSLLVRAYVYTHKEKYLQQAITSIRFMLTSVEDGGTSLFDGDDLVLLEYTHLPAVLNGWIFAAFGLYDLSIVADKNELYLDAFHKTIKTIEKYLSRFDNGYWSLYDLGKKITSPFYHRLHIAQMQALYIATGDKIFDDYAVKWDNYSKKWINRKRAFIKKAWQKIIE